MSEEIRAHVGARLKEERDRLGWSQATLAETAGASRRAVVAWEGGVTVPGADALAALAPHGFDVLYIVIGQRSAPVESRLSPDEATLLKNYQHSDAEGRAAARTVLSSLAKQKTG
ncbi:helix-turn-helix domain-containing protein [Variovorax paradoxus]|uniref:helix-turn-helix domain-containing protein n=1 Tax=Variovorax paradoxus TaxID=34073 RepID=UPI0009BE7727|nr:helix-turn-helix transcriptional regulator [Variovorax paradoxus]